MTYTESELFKLARRRNNTKRSYLLVDPLQGKHIPVSPTACLDMLHTLGVKLNEKYPDCRLVVGFAETATAVGAAVAECMGEGCFYMHTTREDMPEISDWVEFSEEHSHAVEQKLAAEPFEENLARTDTVIFVDDELSTGKTLINMLEQLRGRFTALKGKRVVAASIINRVSPENMAGLEDNGIVCEQLLKLENIDYTEKANAFEIFEPDRLNFAELDGYESKPKFTHVFADGFSITNKSDLLNTLRAGMEISAYNDMIARRIAEDVVFDKGNAKYSFGNNVLVLGTEECMFAGLKMAKYLEDSGQFKKVSFHATTRSPIGICSDKGYPITSGFVLPSLYDPGRTTYIYDLQKYDGALIVSDCLNGLKSAEFLAGVLKYVGIKKRVEVVVI